MLWDPPRYKRLDKLPFIPTEVEIDQLIFGCSQKVSVFLQLLKETAIRCGEAWSLKWIDVDFKSSACALISMLNSIPRNSDKIFNGTSVSNLRRTFQRQRKRIAHKLGNPRLNQITFHTFRHWKATILYHQTKDVYYVMQFLGHRNINNTLKYIQSGNALFKNENEAFICKVASTVEEAKELIEVGFEYVCEFGDVKAFRKRK